MAVSPRLSLRQTQSPVITPQLQQAIRLLQLSNLELAEWVEGEIEQNPLLAHEEWDQTNAAGEADRTAETPEPGSDGEETRDSAEMAEASHIAGENDAPLDTDPAETWEDDRPWTASGPAGPGAGSDGQAGLGRGIEQLAGRPASLREHLLQQIGADFQDPADRVIAARLVELLDESGWLAGDPAEVAAETGCTDEQVAGTLARLRRLDPPGIFARDLRECLALQLADRNRLDPAMEALLDNLDLLAGQDRDGLLEACGVGEVDLVDMIAELRALDPKPGLAFENDTTQPLVPDVFMRREGKGWIVELNAETLPRVLVDQAYYTEVRAGMRDRSERAWISDCYQSANWLVRALHQRATTILRVSSEIIRRQEAFFRHGVSHLRPMVLRDVAEAIEMHESTVSRVTSNKYMATPRGIFELKYFFTQAIAGQDGGEALSAESVRQRIREIIDGERPAKPLSDDGIATLLHDEGVDVARRTVAKYREALKISPSSRRRREKTATL